MQSLLRLLLAGTIVVSVTLAMLGISQFMLTGTVKIFSFSLVG